MNNSDLKKELRDDNEKVVFIPDKEIRAIECICIKLNEARQEFRKSDARNINT